MQFIVSLKHENRAHYAKNFTWSDVGVEDFSVL